MWDDIYKPNSIGSEGGTIIADEEYKESCRITLERCERYDAITCGVYGCMMHTAFCMVAVSLLTMIYASRYCPIMVAAG